MAVNRPMARRSNFMAMPSFFTVGLARASEIPWPSVVFRIGYLREEWVFVKTPLPEFTFKPDEGLLVQLIQFGQCIRVVSECLGKQIPVSGHVNPGFLGLRLTE